MRLVALTALVPTAIFWHGAGPEELSLDFVCRTYRLRRGAPFLFRTDSGGFEEIDRLCVKRIVTQSGSDYHLLVAWRTERLRPFVLGTARSEGEALERIQGLARRIGVRAEGAEAYEGTRQASRDRRVSRLALLTFGLFGAAMVLPLGLSDLLLVQVPLDSHGVAATGRVLRLERQKHSAVRFAFVAEGRSIQGRNRMAADSLARLRVGGPVHVEFLRSNPTICRAEGSLEKGSDWSQVVLGALTLLLAGWAALRPRRRGPARAAG